MPKRKEKQGARKAQERKFEYGNEFWGVVFFAVGVLVSICLVSHLVNPSDNILGTPGFGLAAGLRKLFGTPVSFLFPLAALHFGYILFRGRVIRTRSLVVWGLLVFELSILLAIRNQPSIHSVDSFAPNIVGNLVVYAFAWRYFFGTHRFGPYFLVVFALVLTLAGAANLNIRQIAALVWRLARFLSVWLCRVARRAWSSMFARKQLAQAMAADTPPQAAAGGRTRSERGPQGAAAPAAASAVSGEMLTDVEEVARRLLEEELTKFREKRHEPVKITTMETKPDEEEPEQAKPAAQEPPQESKPAEEAEQKTVEKQQAPEGEEAAEEEDEWVEEGADKEEYVEEEELEDYYKVPTEERAAAKPKKQLKPYELPSPDILSDPPSISSQLDRVAIEVNSHTLEKTLMNFGIEGKVVNVSPGPVVSRYEIELAPGIKISRVVSLHDDLAMAVGGKKIRIEAPIPGKAAVGIELPNDDMQLVYFKHIMLSEAFTRSKAKLPIIVGRNIAGAPLVSDIAKMPHLLIAGQTGSGKSVCINSIICSLLMTKKPDELRLIMVDPKKVELSYYEGIPHLMAPVVTESKEAVRALQWAVMEMARRYKVLARAGARNIDSFNKRIAEGSIRDGALGEDNNKPMPFIVVIVDELADLILTAKGDVEALIQRIAQLARAVGIHLIVATQRPSVDIITGPIKANLTSRIAFRCIQAVDSRTILGHQGAEKLLGRGDMLFLRSGAPDIERYHGSFISEEDVERVVTAARDQEVALERIESFERATGDSVVGEADAGEASGERDEHFAEGARLVVSVGQGSTSLLQRRLKLGFARAGRLMDQLHEAGIVGASEGSKAREVLVGPDELEDILSQLGY